MAGVVADPLPDLRNQLLVVHGYRAMATARMMAIAAGHEDADDLDALRHDSAFLIACDRAPEGGLDIPSRPTISRLENVADVKSLDRIGIGFIDLFLDSYKTPPRSIVLDIVMLKACSPPARLGRPRARRPAARAVQHGRQSAKHVFDTTGHCLQPIHIFEGNSGTPILSLMRPGKRPAGEEIAQVLWHVIHRIRRRWPKVRILIRGDSHYCAPEVLDLARVV